MAFEPGEAFQFDWWEDWAVIGNERTKLQIAHTKPSYSRAFVVRAYLPPTHEMLFDAHNHAFRVFGGIVASTTTRARRPTRLAEERSVTLTSASLAMASHYVIEPEFLQSCVRLEEGTSREECSGCPSSFLSTDRTLSIAGRPERLA
ncbi:transposase [Rhizobium sp. BK313]|nr:transposase [Rhizobium sp. BK313]